LSFCKRGEREGKEEEEKRKREGREKGKRRERRGI